MKMSMIRKTCWNTSAIKLTDEGVRAKSDFPRIRPLNKNPGLFISSGLFLFCLKLQRNEPGRRVPICAFCTLLAIFRAKLCATLPLDIFPIVWYNIIVIKGWELPKAIDCEYGKSLWRTLITVKRGTSCGEINSQAMEIRDLVYNKRTDTNGSE